MESHTASKDFRTTTRRQGNPRASPRSQYPVLSRRGRRGGQPVTALWQERLQALLNIGPGLPMYGGSPPPLPAPPRPA